MSKKKGTVCKYGINDMPVRWTVENEWNKRVYKKWSSMLQRCYDDNWLTRHPHYIGCYVCDRWLKLSNFVEDIVKIDNYIFWLNNPKQRIALDKDIKSNGNNKCYCLEECMFVTQDENSKQAVSTRDNNYLKNLRGREFSDETKRKMSDNHADVNGKNNPYYNKGEKIAQLSLEGKIIKIWDNAVRASEELGISYSGIRKCCNGKQNKAGEFKWKMFEEGGVDE